MIRDTSQMDEKVKPSKRGRWWIAGAVGVLVLAAVLTRPVLSRWAASEASVAGERLRFATVERGDLVHDVSVQGRVVAASRSTLFAPSAGVVSLAARQGEKVAEGEVLATLESPEIENRLAQERATLDSLRSELARLELSARQRRQANRQEVDLLEVRTAAARREVERNRRLAQEGLLNEMELRRAEDELALRRLELRQAKSDLELEAEMSTFEIRDAELRRERQELVVADAERQVAELEIRAPFDGLLAAVEIEDHDAVVRGQPVVGVVDLGELEVEVSIPETYADDLAPGLAALVEVEGETHRGELVRISPEVRSGQVEGRVAFAGGTPPGLRQNQRLATRIVLAERDGVLKVRRGPFFESMSGRGAYVVEDGMAVHRPVTFGAVSVHQVEIVDGLQAGEEIVLSDLSRFEGAERILIRK